MADIVNKYQIIQKTSSTDNTILHPETQADIVSYSNEDSGLNATNVQDAIDETKELIDDIVGGGVVTGVKGNQETSYRTGQVNLTAENIGAESSGAVSTHNSSTSAHSDIRTAVSNAQNKADSAYALAEGKSKGVSYTSISAMITAVNALAKSTHKVGDNIYIATAGVPDLWVYSVENTASQYSYTTDTAFVNDLKTNTTVQVGYFKLAMLEGDKVDLREYQKSTDNSLTTTSKTIVGGINEVKSGVDTNASEITKIKNGTTKVGSASSADTATTATTATNATNATNATQADKWKTARTIGVDVKSGKKADGSTDISGSGNQSVDGSANKTIDVTLGDSGVTAGTYSAIQVNAKGIAVAGGQIVEIGTSGQTQPSATLANGGLFFKQI